MNARLTFFLIISALSGALSFVVSETCWWLILFFLIPLFVSISSELLQKPWRAGLLWGLIFFGVQSSWIFFLMVQKTGCPWLGILVAALFVGYCSLYAILWFSSAAMLSRWRDSSVWRVASFGFVGFLIFYWLERGAFFITGQFDGYPMVQPLLPLAEKPSLLYFLPIISSFGLLASLIWTQGSIALCLMRHRLFGFLALLGTLPFVVGMLCWKPHALPPYNSKIWYIAPKNAAKGADVQACKITRELAAVHKMYPAIEFFVMPESMLAVSLTDNPRFIKQWNAALSNASVLLILGAQLHKNQCWFNTLYGVKQGRVVAMHSKNHCIPFVEYMPFPWNYLSPLRNLFLGDCYAFSRACHDRKPIEFAAGLSLVPYICSELYFCYCSPEFPPEYPLVCIVNDSWFVPYIRRLLFLSARCKAMSWQRDILYVGHYHGYCITSSGNHYLLNTRS